MSFRSGFSRSIIRIELSPWVSKTKYATGRPSGPGYENPRDPCWSIGTWPENASIIFFPFQPNGIITFLRIA